MHRTRQPPSRTASASPATPPDVPSATAPSTTAPPPTTAAPDGEEIELGRSVEGRPITVIRRGTPGGTAIVAVGAIHGDEDAGVAIIDELRRVPVPDGIELWLVPSMNPDGQAGRRSPERQRRRSQPQLPRELVAPRRTWLLAVRRPERSE
ncbi:MAG: M14 family zinc carboxypeptidase [Ilumatobacteraceae bacterium]